ncbi:MAG: S-adenosylmethionine decarboxylase [Acidobacteriota bacterium]
MSEQNLNFGDAWGYHMAIDCFGCTEDACTNLDRGYEFLDEICDFLNMTKQTQPYIFKTCKKTFPGVPGYSGWVPIIESGIQVHTSANNNFISIDVYSCKHFEPAKVEQFVRDWFEPEDMEIQILPRGREAMMRRREAALAGAAS